MNIPFEPTEILGLDIGKQYDLYCIIRIEQPNENEEQLVENGINTKFHIMSHINGNHYDKHKKEQIVVKGKGINYNTYYKEIKNRKTLMLKAIFEQMEKQDIQEEDS